MANALLLSFLVASAVALAPRSKHIPQYVFGRPYGGFMNQIDDYSVKDIAAPFDCDLNSYVEGYVVQSLDHFSNTSSTWRQFYQYNHKFYKRSSDLVFFVLGGEAAIGPKWVCQDNIPYIALAKKYKAAVIQAEHRFFGHSRPTATLSVADLKWLTPEQVLADYNNFIKLINAKYFGKKQMRWVLFGSSYPGTVAAWMRVAYPNASIGAFASSAAVDLVVDNYNFAVNVQKSYERVSSVCARNIGAAFKEIQRMSYSASGREQLDDIFNACTEFPDPESIQPKDLQYFWTNIFTTFINLNQYSGTQVMNPNYGMSEACAIMNDVSEPDVVVRVQKVLNWAHQREGGREYCVPNNYDEFVGALEQTDISKLGSIADLRVWIYQCCSYLGYFQTTDSGRDSGIWGSLLPLDWYVDQCISLFGPKFNLDFIHAKVNKYSKMFGNVKHYKGTKIVFTNGDMDPWVSLGLGPADENQAKQVFGVVIDKGVHCTDMFPAQKLDSASLKAARAFTAAKLDHFIQSV